MYDNIHSYVTLGVQQNVATFASHVSGMCIWLHQYEQYEVKNESSDELILKLYISMRLDPGPMSVIGESMGSIHVE